MPSDRVYLPETDVHWKFVKNYVEREPLPGYRQATDAARERFRDLKFGVRIHWGLYSLWHLQNESWKFLDMEPKRKAEYLDLAKRFDPKRFDADAWMRLFADTGIRVFAFTTKHHDGFSLFDTKTRVKRRVDWAAPGGPRLEDCDTTFSVMESPMRRDVVRELCDAARRHGIAIDLYFSHPDWYDADFRPYNHHPARMESAIAHPEEWDEWNGRGDFRTPDPSPSETARMVARHRQQLRELLTNYGPIDLLCLDMWLGPKVWPRLRETIMELRRLAPDVMLRCRGIGSYGDYYTPEGFVPGARENTDMPWMVIYPLGRSFSYEPEASEHKGGPWIVRSLVDSVAKGGAFMVGVGPDGNGEWHPSVHENFAFAGDWMRVNAGGIHATRPRAGELWHEGDDVRFTRSKDGKITWAWAMRWPGASLHLATLEAGTGTEVRLEGFPKPLTWRQRSGGLEIDIPAELQPEARRPCREVWGFRVTGAKDRTVR
jgi:alpha-L-fucosidase